MKFRTIIFICIQSACLLNAMSDQEILVDLFPGIFDIEDGAALMGSDYDRAVVAEDIPSDDEEINADRLCVLSASERLLAQLPAARREKLEQFIKSALAKDANISGKWVCENWQGVCDYDYSIGIAKVLLRDVRKKTGVEKTENSTTRYWRLRKEALLSAVQDCLHDGIFPTVAEVVRRTDCSNNAASHALKAAKAKAGIKVNAFSQEERNEFVEFIRSERAKGASPNAIVRAWTQGRRSADTVRNIIRSEAIPSLIKEKTRLPLNVAEKEELKKLAAERLAQGEGFSAPAIMASWNLLHALRPCTIKEADTALKAARADRAKKKK